MISLKKHGKLQWLKRYVWGDNLRAHHNDVSKFMMSSFAHVLHEACVCKLCAQDLWPRNSQPFHCNVINGLGNEGGCCPGMIGGTWTSLVLTAKLGLETLKCMMGRFHYF